MANFIQFVLWVTMQLSLEKMVVGSNVKLPVSVEYINGLICDWNKKNPATNGLVVLNHGEPKAIFEEIQSLIPRTIPIPVVYVDVEQCFDMSAASLIIVSFEGNDLVRTIVLLKE